MWPFCVQRKSSFLTIKGQCHSWGYPGTWYGQTWGLLSQIPPFRYFPNFSALPKHTLTIEYQIHIWRVSAQISCSDTCQIWMRFKESNRYLSRSKILLTEKLMNRALVSSIQGHHQASYWQGMIDEVSKRQCTMDYCTFLKIESVKTIETLCNTNGGVHNLCSCYRILWSNNMIK